MTKQREVRFKMPNQKSVRLAWRFKVSKNIQVSSDSVYRRVQSYHKGLKMRLHVSKLNLVILTKRNEAVTRWP